MRKLLALILLFLTSGLAGHALKVSPPEKAALTPPQLVTGAEKLAQQASLPQTDPGGVVEGVNVVNGSYFAHEVDLVVKGVEPLTVSRSYFSDSSHYNLMKWS